MLAFSERVRDFQYNALWDTLNMPYWWHKNSDTKLLSLTVNKSTKSNY